MSAQPSHHPTIDDGPARRAVGWVAEFVWVLDAIGIALITAAVVLSGANPLDSGALLVIAACSALILTAHHVWYRRHQGEITRSPEHHHDRERRGF